MRADVEDRHSRSQVRPQVQADVRLEEPVAVDEVADLVGKDDLHRVAPERRHGPADRATESVAEHVDDGGVDHLERRARDARGARGAGERDAPLEILLRRRRVHAALAQRCRRTYHAPGKTKQTKLAMTVPNTTPGTPYHRVSTIDSPRFTTAIAAQQISCIRTTCSPASSIDSGA